MTDPRRIEALAAAAAAALEQAFDRRDEADLLILFIGRAQGHLDAILRECQRERETG